MTGRLSLRLINRGQQGMTLIEVLVALGILAAVGATFMIGLTVSSKASIVSLERVNAESLAKSQMENTKAETYVPEATTYTVTPIPSDLQAQGYAVSVAAQPLHTPDDGIQRITVTVTLQGKIPFTLVTLEDYKVNR